MIDRELALMNGIKNEFPAATNLLCAWHIEKNVLANCKKYFGCGKEFNIFMGRWQNVIFSATKAMFKYNWVDVELFYNDNKGPIEYIKKEVKDKICLSVEHEFNEIKVTLASEKIKVLLDCDIPIFRQLLYHVSHFAIKEIYEQYKKIKAGNMAPCTGHFTSTMGFPCAHKIEYYVINEMSLPLDLIHPQWRFDSLLLDLKDGYDGDDTIVKLLKEFHSKYQSWPLNKKEFAVSMISNFVNESDTFFEPVIKRPKGRPPKAKKKRGTTSTTRDPSRFEYVESSVAHNSSSSTSMFQIKTEVTQEFGYGDHGNLMDLCVSSDFSINFTSME